jgi:hypothetical protein
MYMYLYLSMLLSNLLDFIDYKILIVVEYWGLTAS